MASTDKLEDNRGFAEKNEATFPILSDTSKETVKAWGVKHPLGFAKRVTVYIDDKGHVIKIDESVNPRTAGVDLVANLEALGVPKI